MKPILSRFETNLGLDEKSVTISPLEQITSVDRIYKSTLLQPNIALQIGTKETFVEQETTDDE